MTFNSTSNSPSILEGGKLKPGIYKIQNINTETYLDIEVDTREVRCRPAKDLKEGRGLVSWSSSFVAHISDNLQWEIKKLGAGYTVQRVSFLISFEASVTRCEKFRVQVDPGKPEQFCTPLKGIQNGITLRVTPYPLAWNIKVVNDNDNHRGFEYVRSD